MRLVHARHQIAVLILPVGERRYPGTSLAVSRMSNHGQTGAPSHRFATDHGLYERFVETQGWDAEGIASCGPYPPGPP